MTDRERAHYEDAKRAHAALMKFYPLTLDDLDGEIWRDILGYVGSYQISNFGRTKSFFKGKVKIRKPCVDTDGYLNVNLGRGGKTHKVHRLVALAFIPNPDNKPQVNHIFGNKMDNYVGNLEWCTNCENNHHAITMGLRKSHRGARRKLTDEQVAWCRKVHIPFDKEFGIAALANKFGVSQSCMNDILHRKPYKDVE